MAFEVMTEYRLLAWRSLNKRDFAPFSEKFFTHMYPGCRHSHPFLDFAPRVFPFHS